MKLLQANNISKSFGGLKAISKVTFNVEESEILALIGPNGAGKTTLLNLITNFIAPDDGHVVFCKKSIDGLPRHEIVKLGIARTFQTLTVFENLSAIENIIIGHSSRVKTTLWDVLDIFKNGKKKKESSQSISKSIDDVVSFVNLDKKYLYSKVDELPIVSKKRVAIACALASKPKLLLLDEPLAGLNQIEAEELLKLIIKSKTIGTSVLLIDHNLEAVMSIADRVLVLNFGELVCSGTPAEIICDKKVCEIYLGE